MMDSSNGNSFTASAGDLQRGEVCDSQQSQQDLGEVERSHTGKGNFVGREEICEMESDLLEPLPSPEEAQHQALFTEESDLLEPLLSHEEAQHQVLFDASIGPLTIKKKIIVFLIVVCVVVVMAYLCGRYFRQAGHNHDNSIHLSEQKHIGGTSLIDKTDVQYDESFTSKGGH